MARETKAEREAREAAEAAQQQSGGAPEPEPAGSSKTNYVVLERRKLLVIPDGSEDPANDAIEIEAFIPVGGIYETTGKNAAITEALNGDDELRERAMKGTVDVVAPSVRAWVVTPVSLKPREPELVIGGN